MSRIDDLRAEKIRFQNWKAGQTQILKDRLKQVAHHADLHCAQIDREIAAEQARLDAAAGAAAPVAQKTAGK